MNLMDYTIETAFLPKLKCGSVAQAVTGLVGSLDPAAPLDENLVRDVMSRESEGNTAVGGGLVIPHARSTHARRLTIAVATLAEPLDVPAADDRAVDVVILLVGPPSDPRQMLRVLARLARLVKQEPFLTALRAAGTSADLRRAFAAAVDGPA